MIEQPVALRALLPGVAAELPVRAEALLHAFAAEDGPPPEPGAAAYVERWDEVELAVETFVTLGLAVRRPTLNKIAETA